MKKDKGRRVVYSLGRMILPVFLGVAAWYPAQNVLAQGTPWIAEPRTGSCQRFIL